MSTNVCPQLISIAWTSFNCTDRCDEIHVLTQISAHFQWQKKKIGKIADAFFLVLLDIYCFSRLKETLPYSTCLDDINISPPEAYINSTLSFCSLIFFRALFAMEDCTGFYNQDIIKLKKYEIRI